MAKNSEPPPPRDRRDADPRLDDDRASDLIIINEFAVSLLQQQTLDDLLWSISQTLGELLGLDDLVLYLRQGDYLVQKAAFGIKNPTQRQIASPLTIPVGRGITGTVAATGEMELVADTRLDPRYIPDEFSGRSELAIPILYRESVLAVLDSESKVVNGFSPRQQSLAVSCANIAAPRIATAIAEQQRQQAERELQNVNERLEQRVRDRTSELEAAFDRLNKEAAERQRLQDEILKSRNLESLSVMAGGVAHDFNNMLQGITAHLAQASVALVSDPDDARRCLQAAEDACIRARDLTQQLQTFAKGGAPILRVQTLNAVVHDTVQFSLRGRNVRAQMDVAADLHPVSMDASQISRVIQNLVLNGAEAMPEGGTLRVSAQNCRLDGELAVSVSVEDQGAGVPAENRGKVFDPYFTTKAESGGSGLGLALAYRIAQRHGGTLEHDPSYVDGARFRLTLLAAPSAAEAGNGTEGSRPANPPPMRLLLMDDEYLVREATAGLLRRLGMHVVEAANGEEALALVANLAQSGRAIEAAILDLTVPGHMGGLETMRQLRQNQPSLPIAVISGYSNTPVLGQFAEHGFQAALSKPCRVDELRHALNALAAAR